METVLRNAVRVVILTTALALIYLIFNGSFDVALGWLIQAIGLARTG